MILAKYTRRIWESGGQSFGNLLKSEPGEATTDAALESGSDGDICIKIADEA